MLARQNRLLVSYRDWRHSEKTPFFLLKVRKNGLGLNRFGFVTGKKIDKRATVRNRIKRVLRSCIEERLAEIVPGNDLLFILQKGAIGQARESICQELEKKLKKLNLRTQ